MQKQNLRQKEALQIHIPHEGVLCIKVLHCGHQEDELWTDLWSPVVFPSLPHSAVRFTISLPLHRSPSCETSAKPRLLLQLAEQHLKLLTCLRCLDSMPKCLGTTHFSALKESVGYGTINITPLLFMVSWEKTRLAKVFRDPHCVHTHIV